MINNFEELATTELRKKALEIVNAGLEAINTEKILREGVRLEEDKLIIKNKIFDLNGYKRVFVIGFGKASSLMAKVIEEILKDKIEEGIVISTNNVKLDKIKVIEGTHPMPSQGNIDATKEIIELVEKLNEDDLVICLISGGGSALLCYPTVPLEQYMEIVNKAYTSGIDISEFNKIRKEYSNVKGGKLAKLTKAKIVSLILSDVVGDDLATIASGPTYGEELENADNILLLTNKVSLQAMKEKAVSLGLEPVVYSDKIEGEARLFGKEVLEHFEKNPEMNCLLFAGETTVTVRGRGVGGRNQELCLSVLEQISKLKNTVIVSAGTDGIDGPTDAAGAIVDSESLGKSIKENLDYKEYLENNDSYNFFKKTNELIFTGITCSNVADVGLIVKE